MFAVPGPVKKVFDAFPLRSYDPVPASNDAHTEYINSHKYYFDGSASGDASFTLGVHNVIELVGRNKFVPSDPISLGQTLVLAKKNNLKLPRGSSIDKTDNSIMVLPYQASSDNQLPILIEDAKGSRTIRNLQSINRDVAANNLKGNASLIIDEMINVKFADIWIMALLTEDIPVEVVAKIFNLEESATNRLEMLELKGEIPNWMAFKVRNPFLFDSQYKKLLGSTNDKIQAYYQIQLRSFKADLELLVNFLNKDPEPVLQLKVVGYIVIIDTLLKGTKLHSTIAEYPDFINECYEVVELF